MTAKAPVVRRSGFCGAIPWPIANGSTYNPHERCRMDGCPCACHLDLEEVAEEVADELEPAGVQLAIDVTAGITSHAELHRAILPPIGSDPYAWPQLDQGAAPQLPVSLTLEERRRIIAAHLEHDPTRMLAVVVELITERITP